MGDKLGSTADADASTQCRNGLSMKCDLMLLQRTGTLFQSETFSFFCVKTNLCTTIIKPPKGKEISLQVCLFYELEDSRMTQVQDLLVTRQQYYVINKTTPCQTSNT